MPRFNPTDAQHAIEAENSSSTLRVRLQSHDLNAAPPPAPEPQAQSFRQQDVYKQIRDSFILEPSPETANPAREQPLEDVETLIERMRESFAQTGINLHASATENITAAHSEINDRIGLFNDMSTAIGFYYREIYDNIAYPLSSTLCHADNHPTATIDDHLFNMARQLDQANDAMNLLKRRWDECIAAEAEARMEIDGTGPETQRQMDAVMFDQSDRKDNIIGHIDAVLLRHNELLERIEAGYKQSLQDETVKMMQSIMAD